MAATFSNVVVNIVAYGWLSRNVKITSVVSSLRVWFFLRILKNFADTAEELREPLVQGGLTIYDKNETSPILESLKKTKQRKRITKKLERVKKGWTKRKHSASEKGRAVKGALSRMTGFKTDPDMDDCNTTRMKEQESDS